MADPSHEASEVEGPLRAPILLPRGLPERVVPPEGAVAEAERLLHGDDLETGDGGEAFLLALAAEAASVSMLCVGSVRVKKTTVSAFSRWMVPTRSPAFS